jgi:hypothetical protein
MSNVSLVAQQAREVEPFDNRLEFRIDPDTSSADPLSVLAQLLIDLTPSPDESKPTLPAGRARGPPTTSA